MPNAIGGRSVDGLAVFGEPDGASAGSHVSCVVPVASHDVGDWRAAGLRFHTYNFALRRRFGERVHRVSVDAGFTCPNVDGTVAVGGCVFCDNRSFSPSRRIPRIRSITEQLDRGIAALQRRYRARKFLAYFQPATNTYAPVEHLRAVYDEALAHPQIVGLVIGTRPDCADEPVLQLLEGYARRTYVAVEYGLQTIHERSLAWMNRGHGSAAFFDAVRRSRGRGFEIGTHVILGLPGETREDVLATAEAIAQTQIDAVKIHNLYVVHNTPLAEMHRYGDVRLLERGEYVGWVADFLERLPAKMVVERLSGDAPPQYLIAPLWCRDKHGIHADVVGELERRESYQGSGWPGPHT